MKTSVVSAIQAYELWNKGFTNMTARGYGVVSFDSPNTCTVIVFGAYFGYEEEMFHHTMELNSNEEIVVYV